MAISARPTRPRRNANTQDEHHDGDGEREQVEPLVRADRQAERRRGLDDDDALDAAGPMLDALVFEDLRGRDRQRKGREREIEPLQPQRRQAEQEAGAQADQAGRGDRRPIGQVPAIHHDRGGIGADREERAMAERNLPVVAGEDVETEQRDGITDRQRELESPIVADEERQRACRDQQHCKAATR